MIVISGPTLWRIARISSGEQTIARAPPLTEILDRATALSRALSLKPMLVTSDSDNEVKIVTPVTHVEGSASTAAAIIALPPEA
jgi:hypothetical protein